MNNPFPFDDYKIVVAWMNLKVGEELQYTKSELVQALRKVADWYENL